MYQKKGNLYLGVKQAGGQGLQQIGFYYFHGLVLIDFLKALLVAHTAVQPVALLQQGRYQPLPYIAIGTCY
jgi:hypothetical protein